VLRVSRLPKLSPKNKIIRFNVGFLAAYTKFLINFYCKMEMEVRSRETDIDDIIGAGVGSTHRPRDKRVLNELGLVVDATGAVLAVQLEPSDFILEASSSDYVTKLNLNLVCPSVPIN
jgi:hypothetical protein